MEKIAVIGGGIIGMTLANYLDTSKFEVTLFDAKEGQATRASAGIISPWLSKRRNKQWYQLAKDGAAFFPKLIQDLALDDSIYKQSGTLIFRTKEALEDLAALAEERKKEAPEIGDISLLSAEETAKALPLLKPTPSLFVSGGGRLDGHAYLSHLAARLEQKRVQVVSERVQLRKEATQWLVSGTFGHKSFDRVILAPGPSLKPLLEEIGICADIRPQKGQLIVFQTPYLHSQEWPVAMLEGEADFIPFNNGTILVGATHENDARWDLAPTETAYQQLIQNTAPFLTDSDQLATWTHTMRVGTRAYTSDFAPFFAPVPEEPTLIAASGLGSSGLTTGPYIGYLIADYLNTGTWRGEHYQKPIGTYLSRI
ncbi:FAD-binding oxidoreductase [Enterococcus sp. DIV1298c]|uniref:NAD(P)/FAD-dependent oxidoreductase n=1 Tax=Enterococcus sp. DIV1298c TaxID=2815328 RepID=UPI001A9140FD|nr:FAD-dependent oxidoreductase [Enterococcus sp. DIV1298c]MBO0461218.1 FAD-binding oxidoreductase [Enterococcus sp. DIV1298c]